MSASSESGGSIAELLSLIRPEATGALPANPCKCQQATDAKKFKANDKANACSDKAAADDMLFDFDELCLDPKALDSLSAADLNNVACALVWQTTATSAAAERAVKLLEMASKRDSSSATKKIIEANMETLRPELLDLPAAQYIMRHDVEPTPPAEKDK